MGQALVIDPSANPGYGYGDGYGSGYGYGDGYGDGSGDGYGSGYGYGDGYGDGYYIAALQTFTSHPLVTKATKDTNITLAFWRSDKDGHASNGGRKAEPARPGLLQEIQGPLKICTSKALHGSMKPDEWQGERWWVVALYEPVVWDGNKCASLKRLIIEELK